MGHSERAELPGGEWYNPYGDPSLSFAEAGAVMAARRDALTAREARYWCDIQRAYVPLSEHSPMSLTIYRADPQAWHRLHPQDPAEFADRDAHGSAGAAIEES